MIPQLIELKFHFRIKTTMANGMDAAKRGPVIQADQRADHHRQPSSDGIPPRRSALQIKAKFVTHRALSTIIIAIDDKVGVFFTMWRKMDALNGNMNAKLKITRR
jgi:hypothetical protein